VAYIELHTRRDELSREVGRRGISRYTTVSRRARKRFGARAQRAQIFVSLPNARCNWELKPSESRGRTGEQETGRDNMRFDPANSDAESKARSRPGGLGHKHTQRLDRFYDKLIMAYGEIFKRDSREETTLEGRQ
jgi:hypothetical protein